MLMLVSCRNSLGFTLLELLVVLGLVTVLLALVFPGLVRLYDSVSGNLERKDIVLQVNGLGRSAFESGLPFELTSQSLDLPAGWQVEVRQPITYTAKGVCRGGTVSLIKDDVLRLEQKLQPPYCQISDES